ncbi:MAG: acetyl-CoA carboxylase biotin carboxyl carrier protein subunit [Burkholderiaceae bacterium]
MDLPQIKAFIDAMASSDLAEMEAAHEGWTLRLVRRPGAARAAAAPAAPAPAQPSAADLPAPMFGVLHLQPSPGAAPFVSPGQAVRAGQTVCVIEAMKVFNEVLSDRDGVVDAVLAANGSEVEAGQPLLRLR